MIKCLQLGQENILEPYMIMWDLVMCLTLWRLGGLCKVPRPPPPPPSSETNFNSLGADIKMWQMFLRSFVKGF